MDKPKIQIRETNTFTIHGNKKSTKRTRTIYINGQSYSTPWDMAQHYANSSSTYWWDSKFFSSGRPTDKQYLDRIAKTTRRVLPIFIKLFNEAER